jgi:1-acyl-sn-glycerol-3-phosphate acyltransferase
MTQSQRFKSGSVTAAVLRVAGFFTLIIFLVPLQLVYPFFKPRDPFRIIRRFHYLLLKLLGFRVRIHGAIAEKGPIFFVANHSSYLDIPVLAALLPVSFVAKAEVATWPLIGFLASLQKTLFIERRKDQINKQRDVIHRHLAQGKNLVLFPEGTSSDGSIVLPFKSALFSIIDENLGDLTLTVQPVSIACTAIHGMPMTRAWRPFYAWYGDMTLVEHLWEVFKFGHYTIDVIFHPPVKSEDFADRKRLTAYCQEQVARGIEQCVTGRDMLETHILKLPAPV